MRKREVFLFKFSILYIIFPVILFFIPPDSLNNLPSLCIYKLLFGIECPGCGMTRAILSLIHLEFSKALAYNKLVVIVFPLLIYMFLKRAFFDIIKLRHFIKK